MGEQWVSLRSGQRGGLALAGDLIVAPGGALVEGGFFFRLPFGFDKFVALETPERGIHGAAGQAGDFHDVESEAVAERERFEDERRGVRESRAELCAHKFYVVCYHK